MDYAAIPMVVIGGAHAYAKYLGIEKQAQGTALYMLAHQLEKLRRNWDHVTDDNKKKLCDSFKRMRDDIVNSSGVKTSTVKRLFNDSFIDPSTFNPQSNAFAEGCRRIGHGLSVAWTSRRDDIPNNIRGYKTATMEERKLCDALLEYHGEASRNGVCNDPFPEAFLENLRMHIPEETYRSAVRALERSFAGVRGANGFLREPFGEYAAPLTKGDSLKKLVEIITGLAIGDRQDVQNFSNAALKAEKDKNFFHNNGTNLFQVLAEVNIRGYKSGTRAEKKLCTSLLRYYTEAKANRVGNQRLWFPNNLLENLREHIPEAEYDHAVGVLGDCFVRVRGEIGTGSGRGPMIEYTNPLTKGKTLNKIVEMTMLLAKGKEQHVKEFVAAALLAEKDCHSNARQIFQVLWQAVLVNKVKKGEVRLRTGIDEVEVNAGEALLRVGMGVFREQELLRATFEVLGNKIIVEQGLAVSIALGKRLGLLDPVEGMGYIHEARNVTPEKLVEIENKFLERVGNQASIHAFLKTWSPLTDWITAQGELARAEFDKAQDAFFDIPGKPTPEQDNAFAEAAETYQKAVSATLDTSIPALLAQYPAALIPEAVADLVFVADQASAQPPLPAGLEGHKWQLFEDALRGIEEGPVAGGTAALAETEHAIRLQSTAQDTTATNSPTYIDHVPFAVKDMGAGGDCLFYALGVRREQIPDTRNALADEILGWDDNRQALNAHYVAAALTQTPALANRAASLIRGRRAVPNSVYAQMVAIPGIYAGMEELMTWTRLPANQGKTVVVVNARGPLTLVQNGVERKIKYTFEDKAAVLQEAIKGADIALYQSDNHWQRIIKPSDPGMAAGPGSSGTGKSAAAASTGN